MKIELDKKHTLYSDSMNIWITRKVMRTKKRSGAKVEEEEVISGYCQDLNHLLNSLKWRKIRGCDVSSIEKLAKVVDEANEQTIKFSKEISKSVMKTK